MDFQQIVSVLKLLVPIETEVRRTQLLYFVVFISNMSEQCGLGIGSEMTSFN